MVVQPDPLINTGKCRLRVGSEINSHSVFKMSSAFRTFENRLCEVIFERSLSVLIVIQTPVERVDAVCVTMAHSALTCYLVLELIGCMPDQFGDGSPVVLETTPFWR